MKRINLSVELEDNELLEKSVEEAVKGLARQIAREAINEEIQKEVERIVEAKMKEAQNGYFSDIRSRITNELAIKLSPEITINKPEVDERIQERVEAQIDKKIGERGSVEKFIRTYVDRALSDVLRAKD